MKTKTVVYLVIAIALSHLGGQHVEASEPMGEIFVVLTDFRSDHGKALVALFKSEDGFPSQSNKACKRAMSKIFKKKATVKFGNMPYGTYAVAIIHDENSSGKLEKNIVGIPREGYGASNNAKGFMGPPKFKDAQFALKSSRKIIRIRVVY